MDPKQTPPSVGNSGNADVSGAQPAATPTVPAPSISSDSAALSATGRSIFANPNKRFRDTNPQGDILLPGAEPATKPAVAKKPLSKGLIIGLVVIALLAVTAVVLLLVLPKGNGGRSNGTAIVEAGSTAEAYNLFYNALTTGEPSSNTPVNPNTLSTLPEFYLTTATDLTAEERSDYLDTLDSLLTNLELLYLEEYGGLGFTSLRAYAVQYPQLRFASNADIIATYAEDGTAGVEELINATYTIDTDSELLKIYVAAQAEIAKASVGYLESAELAGCFIRDNTEIAEDCNASPTPEEQQIISDQTMIATNALSEMKQSAYRELLTAYDTIYGGEENVEPEEYADSDEDWGEEDDE